MRAMKAAFAAISLSAAVTGASVGLASTASAEPNCGHHGGYPPKHDSVQISDNRVRPGQRVSFNSKCYKPKEKVRGTVHSDPIVVGTWTASTSGVVSGSFKVPSSLAPGRHTLELRGLSSGVTESTTFVVEGRSGAAAANAAGTGTGAGSNGSLAFTGADVAGTVGAGLVLLLGGGAMVVTSTRRKHVNSAA